MTNEETPRARVQAWLDRAMDDGYDFHDASIFKMLKLEEVAIAPSGEATTVFSFVVPRALCR